MSQANEQATPARRNQRFENTTTLRNFLKKSGYTNAALGRIDHEKFGEANVKLVDLNANDHIICNVSKPVSDAWRDGTLPENAADVLCVSLVFDDDAIDAKTGKPYENGLLKLHMPGESRFVHESMTSFAL